MWTTIRITEENLAWLKEMNKVPNKALDQIRTGSAEPESELRNIQKKLKDIENRLNILENLEE